MMSIRQKVIVACSVISFLIVGGGAVSLWATTRLAQNAEKIANISQLLRNHMRADMMHDTIRADVFEALLAANWVVSVPLGDVRQGLAEHVADFHKSIDANIELAQDPVIRDELSRLAAPLNDYAGAAEKIVDEIGAGRDATPLLSAFTEKFEALEKTMESAGDRIEAESEAVKASGAVLTARIHLLFEAILAFGMLFSVALAVMSTRLVTRPLLSIARDMGLIAHGNTDIACAGLGRKDEIGEMADAVEAFRKGAIERKRLEDEAVANRAKAEEDRRRLQQEAEAAAQVRLGQATAGLAGGLKKLAAGDLSFELTDAFAPDFEPLRHDLNDAVKQLSMTLRAVAEAAGKIQSGTREISESADNLSKRTEQQAASLEETAAALDEITSNVASSTKRAEEARSESSTAARSATDSGKVVAEAVEAMNRIEQSSTQVNNIIGVIDEIAFQTNLLALNAGVEAARAGEAGKGFAVVAQEVRELAQRSAQAAKEIKELISRSSQEVQGGVKLVSETGAALKTIEGHILSVNGHVEAIATAAREQSTGLSEVNTAVNQMDQVTQQNAAMVEENNASSMTLAAEAEQLRALISKFQLGGSSGTAHRAVSQARAHERGAPADRGKAEGFAARVPAAKVAGGRGGDWEEF